jgi:hypothetical protein
MSRLFNILFKTKDKHISFIISNADLKFINYHFIYVLFHVFLNLSERLLEKFMENVSCNVVIDLPDLFVGRVIMHF